MIHDVLRLIVNQLNRKLGSAGDGESVVLGNIATMDSAGDGGGGGGTANLSRVVLSLVNVTEDQTVEEWPSLASSGRAHYL